MQLTGQAAIVTGGGTGVGRATALRLARLGCAVLINFSRSRQQAHAVAEEAAALGVKALAFQADVADDAACRAMVARAVDAFGRLDILVNNAGTTSFVDAAALDELTDEVWQRIFGVNLLGAFHCCRAVREPMLAAGGGQIVNVSSVAAFSGKGSSIPYAASKAAVNNLTLALARALAPKIRVNAIAPGFITGRWLQEGFGESYDAVKRAVEKRAPLGRVSEPDDIAAAIVSLLTGSSMVTGQIVICDGGSLLGK
jgi:NAD(P)-dependent dehydrogenase (short-subunit alcohol dehydrogenase family)